MYPVEPYEDFSVNKVLDANWGVLYDEDVSIYCLVSIISMLTLPILRKLIVFTTCVFTMFCTALGTNEANYLL